MSRPLYELQLRTGVLKGVSETLRKQCFAIALDKSPSASINLARLAASQHGVSGMEALAVAKATRWLSVIRRDHGETIFNEAVASLSTPTV